MHQTGQSEKNDAAARIRLRVRPPIVAYPFTVAIGAIVGASGPLLLSTDAAFGHVAHLILSAGWSWAALSYFVGLSAESKMRSAAMGAVSLASAVLVYYLTKAQQGEYLTADLSDTTGQTTHFDWGGFVSKVLMWCFFAFLLGPILGLAGNLSRTASYGFPFRLVIPLVAVLENTMRLQHEAGLQGSLATTTWTITRAVAIASIVALTALAALGSRRQRSTA